MPLCVLNDYGRPYFLSRSDVDLILRSRHLMAPELHHYCGMPIDFVCHLPVLDTPRVSTHYGDGINESTRTIVDINFGPEHIAHLQRV
ncbi:hypothetical protein GGF41_000945 [Coemansia sp. RSA 2531]|nr:hypothetical protein GGF41_000945 [Coemansia sp. RSA 2531]